MPRTFHILAATDGSPAARAALTTAVAFPWPEPSLARGLVSLGGAALPMEAAMRVALARILREEPEAAQRILERRWQHAEIVKSRAAPVGAILAEARRARLLYGAEVTLSC